MSIKSLGYEAIERGNFQEAVNIFRKALSQNNSADGYLGLGTAFESLGEFLTARWAYNKALELDPNNGDAKHALATLQETMLRKSKDYPVQHKVAFRALTKGIERLDRGQWVPFFMKGINVGLGLPGYYPGEYPIGKGLYLQWMEQMVAFGFNTVRVYAIHPPSFYEALYDLNHGGGKLYLLQGIWSEPPADNNLSSETYARYIAGQISEAVDVILGSASLSERPGLPSGVYKCDVSEYTIGFLLTREWESCTVAAYNNLHQRRISTYDGSFLRVDGATAFEGWVGSVVESIQSYEYQKYGLTHPVSTVCWPTLDPLEHPSESRYAEGLAAQGQIIDTKVCSEDEDVETLDLAKFAVKSGGGFFASYHVYPYYPDFMNNDYLSEEDPYATYLGQLKEHHGDQPVIVAEFGVPDSREISHWNVKGWHHGGHTDVRQAEVDVLLMKAIHKTGMSGGILFSWFDEWFKRNWLFMKYELPAERKSLWFNLQDAEECYGLIAAYPGYPKKICTLTANAHEWERAAVIAQQAAVPDGSKISGGGLALRSLKAQHDEGFLYLLLETGGAIDFKKGNYIIGLDTCDSKTGEFRMPYGFDEKTPIGLKFAIHIAGPHKSRILACKSYDKYQNQEGGDIYPHKSSEGAWVVMQNKTNDRRFSKDGRRVYPARVATMSNLTYGSLDPKAEDYNSLSDIYIRDNLIELRIPWGLINFTDPSSHMILWKQGKQMTKRTDGVRAMAVSYDPSGPSSSTSKGTGRERADALPRSMDPRDLTTYSWDGWEVPLYHFHVKAGADTYSRMLRSI